MGSRYCFLLYCNSMFQKTIFQIICQLHSKRELQIIWYCHTQDFESNLQHYLRFSKSKFSVLLSAFLHRRTNSVSRCQHSCFSITSDYSFNQLFIFLGYCIYRQYSMINSPRCCFELIGRFVVPSCLVCVALSNDHGVLTLPYVGRGKRLVRRSRSSVCLPVGRREPTHRLLHFLRFSFRK